MARRLGADRAPDASSSARCRPSATCCASIRTVYVVNEGANALDLARNMIDMSVPRHRLDSGTWGVMGIGMGYAIAAAVESGVAGRRDRRRQRIRVQRHGTGDHLPLPTAGRGDHPQQRRRLSRRRGQPVRRPGTDHPDAAGPPRPPDRGVRRQGLPGDHAGAAHHRAHRCTPVGRSGAHRLRDRPRRRHRKRPPHPPQPDRRRSRNNTKDPPQERNPS